MIQRQTTQYLRAAGLAAAMMTLLPSAAAAQGAKPLTKCAPDAVLSGRVCMDKYEASVWRVPEPRGGNKGLIKKIQRGKATLADLTKGGATQLGLSSPDYAPCSENGQNCGDVYAVSLPQRKPSSSMTWFQAQAACTNAAKHLPSNAEWQAAVVGTPDPGPDDGVTDCRTAFSPDGPSLTGSRSGCVSERGVFDMVGNLYEWVADWVPHSTGCTTWGTEISPTGDEHCFAGASQTGDPGALMRGGSYLSGAKAGPLAIIGTIGPAGWGGGIGFRCAR